MMIKEYNKITTYHELDVYKMGVEGAMKIYDLSKKFPSDERYSLTDQIRRSSRSVCANIAEGWRKRRYRTAFISRLSDSETEAAETQVWLEFAYKCKYIDQNIYHELFCHYDAIIGKLVKIIDNPYPWLIRVKNA